MADKIHEITQKIYTEGVIKAKEDASRIIANAKLKADEIIKLAQQKQAELLKESQRQAAEIKRKNEAELQLAARQFISTLKQQITNIVSTAQVNGYVKNALNETHFMQELILTIIKNWNPQTSDQLDLNIFLSETKEKEFTEFFNSKAIEILNKGVEFKFDPEVDTGFKISPKTGNYILSFTDKDFENYFKSYIKDRTKKLLFNLPDND